MGKPTIVAIDLDGTLLADDKSFDRARMVRIVEQLKKQDVHVVACTGNTVERARLHLGEVWGAIEYLICDNGAVIVGHDENSDNPDNVKVLFKQSMNMDDVRRLAEVLQQHKPHSLNPGEHLVVVFNTDTHSYMVEESAPLAESAQKAYYDSKNLPIPEDETPLGYFEAIYPNITYVTWEELLEQKADHITKFALNSHDYDLVPALVDTISRNVILPGETEHNIAFAPSGYGAIAVSPKHINKGSGIRSLILYSRLVQAVADLEDPDVTLVADQDGRKHVNVPNLRVIAIGDEGNDLPMFTYADVAVTPANAKDAVKAQADIVLPGTNNDGVVLDYLETLIEA